MYNKQIQYLTQYCKVLQEILTNLEVLQYFANYL